MRPYLPRALTRLRDQVNAFAPRRSTASDGWLADAAHAGRVSEHNPDPDGSVDALDITHDPGHGLDAHALADRIVRSRDWRLRRIISRGRIVSGRQGPDPWRWRRYDGNDPHVSHIHVETVDGAAANDPAPWAVRPTPDEGVDMTPAEAAQLAAVETTVKHLELMVSSIGKVVDETLDYLKETRPR